MKSAIASMEGVLLLALLLVTSSSICAVQVFYVGSTTECSSADNSPCHSLQYYANNSNFTNNSIFHFLQGQHHLETVITIRNVVNLTLVGASSEVKILCNSPQSGLTVEEFRSLAIENLAFSECSHKSNVSAVFLDTGSELSLNHVTISKSSSDSEYTGLAVNNVTGSFLIRSSVFHTPMGNGIKVLYPLSNRHSHFEFSGNEVSSYNEGSVHGLVIFVDTPNVQMVLTDSNFKQTSQSQQSYSLLVVFTVSTNNSTRISNSSFISLQFCYLNDNQTVPELPGVTVFIENSNLADLSFYYSEITLENTTIANSEIVSALIYFGKAKFVNCIFKNNKRQSVMGYYSNISFQGINIFQNNSAYVGGGLMLWGSQSVHLLPHTTLKFLDNHADYMGGAIFSSGIKIKLNDDPCFYDITSPSLIETVKMVFINNTARYGGSSLFGDGLDNCSTYDQVINVTNTEEDPSAVAGPVENVCFCEQDKLQPNCSVNHIIIKKVFPGQDFTIRLATVTYFTRVSPGAVIGAIHAYFTSNIPWPLKASQISQASEKPYCQNFIYSLNTTQSEISFYLGSEDIITTSLVLASDHREPLALSVTVNLDECPLGFNLSSKSECECDHILAHQQVECDINNQSFLVPDNSWIGFINKKQSTNVTGTGVIFHPNCPFGYCLPHNISITSRTGDDQCEPHRTGLLCGKCQEGYSLTLGSDKCSKCSNNFLLLIIPVAVSGLFLVGVLFALNLTVTEGSINGLLFYANVIAMSRVALILKETRYLYTFLAWLNLDLGIGTCLFDGMDGYTATWLQFVFPVYLWMIILAIIPFYRRFPRLAHRLGQENAVKVLATLLLISYTKLQRTVVTIMSFTSLEYPSGEVRYVWLYDANMEFFKGKHFYLGIAGILVLVFLIVPYTLCLAFFQQLQACSGHRLFHWVNRLKPLFDSYAGPYKDKYRFWTGMLLVVRTILIVVFTANIAGSIEFDLLVILVVSSVLAWAHSNAICKKWPHNYLEAFFHLQLMIFAASMFYSRCNHGNIVAVVYSSIGMCLIVFLAVIGYHIYCCIASFKNRRGYAEIVDEDLDSFIHDRDS